jgi:putative membrane protein
MSLSDLPALNACLNGASTVFLACGYVFIRKGRQIAHRNCMISAFVTSTVFLTSYLIYHYNAGRTVFAEPQWFRPIYLIILLTHTVLAVVIVPMVLMSFGRALKAQRRFPLSSTPHPGPLPSEGRGERISSAENARIEPLSSEGHLLPRPLGGEGWGEGVPASHVSSSMERSIVWRAHRVISRWTLPLWLYVSVTGVLIYFLLYQIFPQK